MKTYTTVSGDTWDKIALEQLGSEYLFPLLLEANQQYRDVLIFSSGVTLTIPEVELEEYEEIPEWLSVEPEEGELEEEEFAEYAEEVDS